MRFLFAITGLLFDLMVLAASCFAIYCAVQPEFFYDSVNLVTEQFETGGGRLRLAGVAVIFVFLSFRGLFLLMFGRGDSTFVIKRDNRGALSVSRSTLERLVDGIAGGMQPPAKVQNLRIIQNDDGLRINMKISLDMAKCNLGEYIEKLNGDVRAYFQDSLGVPVASIDVQASAAASENALAPVVQQEHN